MGQRGTKGGTHLKENIQLEEAIARIFDCNWDADDYNPEGEMYDYAQKILEEFPWEEVFQGTIAYFKGHSSNLDQVLNFIDLYVGNNYIDQPIANPYEFAALIASKVDFDADWERGADRIENFLTCMLDGKGAISLYDDPYYQLLKDPKFLVALDKVKKASENELDILPKSNSTSLKRLYILRWNPEISSYKESVFRRRFKTLNRKNCGGIEMDWSIYEPDDLQIGDWFIFCRVGTANDGIVGLGKFTSSAYPGKSWRGDGRQIMYADMLTLMLQESSASGLWMAEELERVFPEVNWHGGHAGVVIEQETTEKLALRLAVDIAALPQENTADVVLRRGDGGRFSVVCGLLSELCPKLLAEVEASQEATKATDETFIPYSL